MQNLLAVFINEVEYHFASSDPAGEDTILEWRRLHDRDGWAFFENVETGPSVTNHGIAADRDIFQRHFAGASSINGRIILRAHAVSRFIDDKQANAVAVALGAILLCWRARGAFVPASYGGHAPCAHVAHTRMRRDGSDRRLARRHVWGRSVSKEAAERASE